MHFFLTFRWRRYGTMIPYRRGETDYTTELVGFSPKGVYVIRVFVISAAGDVIAVTDEFTVGTSVATTCAGQPLIACLI